MKVATFNTNSVRARLPIILDWLSGEGPDLLCLQETKVQDKDFPSSAFEETGYRTYVRGQKSYNGVALISKNPLDNIRYHLRDEQEDARFIAGELDGVPVVNVYVPQGYAVGSEKFAYKLEWLRRLIDYLEGGLSLSAPIILAGDFNVALEDADLFDPDKFRGEVAFHPEEQALIRRLEDLGFVDVFRMHVKEAGAYTFWDYRIPNGFKRNMGWRIDYIFASAPLAEKAGRCWVDKGPRGMEKPSDHTFLIAEFDI